MNWISQEGNSEASGCQPRVGNQSETGKNMRNLIAFTALALMTTTVQTATAQCSGGQSGGRAGGQSIGMGGGIASSGFGGANNLAQFGGQFTASSNPQVASMMMMQRQNMLLQQQLLAMQQQIRQLQQQNQRLIAQIEGTGADTAFTARSQLTSVPISTNRPQFQNSIPGMAADSDRVRAERPRKSRGERQPGT